jgi:hypothetical protein
MSTLPSNAAALVIRVWREPDVPGFRGRVVATDPTGETGESVVTVRYEEQVHAAVQEWLDRFLGDSTEHTGS